MNSRLSALEAPPGALDLPAGIVQRRAVEEASEIGVLDETHWVEEALRGERDAFERLYDRYAAVVHGILLARVPRIDVEDLVQEVFLTVYRRLTTLRDPAAFPGWIAMIARNRATDHLRRVPSPAGVVCATRAAGPGTPCYEDATAEFRGALESLDFGSGGSAALSTILAGARKRDGLTLWHLLARTRGEDRERVYERLARLVPSPPAVTREGVLRGDRAAQESWRWELPGMPLLPKEGTFCPSGEGSGPSRPRLSRTAPPWPPD